MIILCTRGIDDNESLIAARYAAMTWSYSPPRLAGRSVSVRRNGKQHRNLGNWLTKNLAWIREMRTPTTDYLLLPCAPVDVVNVAVRRRSSYIRRAEATTVARRVGLRPPSVRVLTTSTSSRTPLML